MRPLPFLAADTPAARDPRRPAIIVPVQVALPADVVDAARVDDADSAVSAVGADSAAEAVAAELASLCRAAAATGRVDVIEWRIDPLVPRQVPASAAEVVLACLEAVRSAGLPVLVTLRSAFEGGDARVSEDEYAEVLTRIIAGAGSDADAAGLAIDVEISREHARDLIGAAHAAGWPVVASHHNFAATDADGDLAATFSAMEAAGADVAKIAMMPTAASDVVRMLRATADANERLGVPVLGISMGELGRTTRIMGADFGSCATFAQVGRASAPGQIDAMALAEILDRVLG